MTPEEHQLLIVMFARLNMHLGALIKVLQTHSICSDDDFKAYSEYQHEMVSPVVMQKTAALYREVAKTLGLDVPV